MVKIIILSIVLIAATLVESHFQPVGFRDAVAFPSQDTALPYPYHAPVVERVGWGVPQLRTYGDEYGLLAANTDVASSKLNFGFISTFLSFVSSNIFSVAKAVAVIIANFPKLLIGGFLVIAMCKLTPICAKISQVSSVDQVLSLVTAERLTRAAEFVEAAIEKFNALQDGNRIDV